MPPPFENLGTLGVAGIVLAIVVLYFVSCVRVLYEYQRGVVFRLGRVLDKPKGPGPVLVFWPVDRLVQPSMRTYVTDVPAQDVITRDNVSVTVNAVVYFRVVDPLKAVLEVENYLYATSELAQTTLRSSLGQAELDELLAERERINRRLQEVLDQQTDPWGIKVSLVELKHVDLPDAMQRAMARQAESERERRAEVIHADWEYQAAGRLREAAANIEGYPMAMQVRFLQTLSDIGAEKNTTVVFPVPIDLSSVFPAAGAGGGAGSLAGTVIRQTGEAFAKENLMRHQQLNPRQGPAPSDPAAPVGRAVSISVGPVLLEGDLAIAQRASGIVVFAHGSGSSRHSPRKKFIASELRKAGMATLLMDLITRNEGRYEDAGGRLRFDIELLAHRLAGAARWLQAQRETVALPVGYFGASTGAAAHWSRRRGSRTGWRRSCRAAAGRISRATPCRRSAPRSCSSWGRRRAGDRDEPGGVRSAPVREGVEDCPRRHAPVRGARNLGRGGAARRRMVRTLPQGGDWHGVGRDIGVGHDHRTPFRW